MFGQRLKEERTRLGLTQPMLAEIVGSAKRTVVDWEQEKSSPTAKQLMAMQGLGVDTNYLLTGVRLNTVVEHAEVANYRIDGRGQDTDKLRLLMMLNEPDVLEAMSAMSEPQITALVALIKSFRG